MVIIKEDALAKFLAEKIQTNVYNPQEDDDRFDSTLRTCTPACPDECHKCPGINFDYTAQAATLLLKRAHEKLPVTPEQFSSAIARAIQTFAHGFTEPKNHMCYPQFLLHGIEQNTLEAVVAKIEDNSRIIHETRAQAGAHYGRLALPHELALGIAGCDTEDYFGICHFLHRRDTHAAPSYHYLAKFSVFLDASNKTVYGLTVQGQTSAQSRNTDGTLIKDKKRGRAYARLTALLGKDPRTHTIEIAMDRLRSRGFTRAKIVRPNAHPYALEQHWGFIGKYENAILAAGITHENGIYLEAELR